MPQGRTAPVPAAHRGMVTTVRMLHARQVVRRSTHRAGPHAGPSERPVGQPREPSLWERAASSLVSARSAPGAVHWPLTTQCNPGSCEVPRGRRPLDPWAWGRVPAWEADPARYLDGLALEPRQPHAHR
eukprot:scaffold119575_cov63-Phaeocystis_antarctica.AAC.1